MDSGEKPATKNEPLPMGEIARRIGGVIANLVPNSKPLYRERAEDRAEPRLSMSLGGDDAAAEAEVIHSLDARRKKRGAGAVREFDSPHEPKMDAAARNLDALRKKKSA